MPNPYQIVEPLLLDINIEEFAYGTDAPVLRNIHQKVYNVVRPDVKQGQIVAILGPSGIGKSTLFELMAGLRTPTKGDVKVYDRPQDKLTEVEAGMVGMVYQSYDLHPFLTVRAQLELGARKGGLYRKEAEDKIAFYCDRFRLKEHLRKYPNQLSGGQRQRLAIAQQLLCSNTILLMDEPFSGLDPLIKSNICDLIADIAQLDELQTIVIVSHDIESTLSIADTVWLLGKNADGSATVVEVIDMMLRGLTWRKDIRADRAFQDLCFSIEQRFKTLSDGSND